MPSNLEDYGIDFKLKGVEELFSNLRAIERDIANQLESIIKKAAEIIVDEAKKRVPVDTGKLRNSLTVKTLEVKKDQLVIGVGPEGKDVYYWFFVEFGSANAEAQPYLRPAFENKKNAVKKEISREIKRLLNKHQTKGGL